MSITAISEGNTLRVIRSSEPLAEGAELDLYTAEEIERIVAERLWQSLPASSAEEMRFQAQSASYGEWMEEEEWGGVRESEPGSALPLSDFKPR